MPHATGYFRRVRRTAILKPDLEWNEDDYLVIVDIPRMGAIQGEMEEKVIEQEDIEIVCFNENSARYSNDLTETMRSMAGESLVKESSQ